VLCLMGGDRRCRVVDIIIGKSYDGYYAFCSSAYCRRFARRRRVLYAILWNFSSQRWADLALNSCFLG
jgi:hypothetical protein